MGRVYDKGVETKTARAGQWWRFEVEFKGELARQLQDAALPSDYGAHYLQGVATRWFEQRGVVALPRVSTADFHKIKGEPTTDAKLLSWLARGVRPTVAKLMARYGDTKVRTALGIPLSRAVDAPTPEGSLN